MKVSARSGAGNSFRRWIGVAGAALGLATGLAAGPTLAQGDPWPSRPVTLVVTVATGTVADLVARTLGPKLSERPRCNRSQPTLVTTPTWWPRPRRTDTRCCSW